MWSMSDSGCCERLWDVFTNVPKVVNTLIWLDGIQVSTLGEHVLIGSQRVGGRECEIIFWSDGLQY
jgi:hypothetical protein